MMLHFVLEKPNRGGQLVEKIKGVRPKRSRAKFKLGENSTPLPARMNPKKGKGNEEEGKVSEEEGEGTTRPRNYIPIEETHGGMPRKIKNQRIAGVLDLSVFGLQGDQQADQQHMYNNRAAQQPQNSQQQQQQPQQQQQQQQNQQQNPQHQQQDGDEDDDEQESDEASGMEVVAVLVPAYKMKRADWAELIRFQESQIAKAGFPVPAELETLKNETFEWPQPVAFPFARGDTISTSTSGSVAAGAPGGAPGSAAPYSDADGGSHVDPSPHALSSLSYSTDSLLGSNPMSPRELMAFCFTADDDGPARPMDTGAGAAAPGGIGALGDTLGMSVDSTANLNPEYIAESLLNMDYFKTPDDIRRNANLGIALTPMAQRAVNQFTPRLGQAFFNPQDAARIMEMSPALARAMRLSSGGSQSNLGSRATHILPGTPDSQAMLQMQRQQMQQMQQQIQMHQMQMQQMQQQQQQQQHGHSDLLSSSSSQSSPENKQIASVMRKNSGDALSVICKPSGQDRQGRSSDLDREIKETMNKV